MRRAGLGALGQLAVRAVLAVLAVLAVGACGRGGTDRERARGLFTEVPLDTAPGLSGLAVEPDGALWTVSERDERAYRITLDAQLRPALETFVVAGVPTGIDLEGIALLGPDRFAFGTEGREAGAATVLLAERRARSLVITGAITIPDARLGISLAANQGAEGVCGHGETIIAAIEGAGVADGRRWAPLVRIEAGEIARVHRLWLTTATGKISGLDCEVGPDGTVTGWAIERHFAVTKVLTFVLPPRDGDVTPHEALDLGAILNSRLNLEGIARARDGRVIAVVDNQWKTITGPSELLVFTPGAFE